jgi:hypothetical protein
MKKRILIQPEKISAFGVDRNTDFILVTNSIYKDVFYFNDPPLHYKNKKIFYIDKSEYFLDLLAKKIADGSHILTILTECLLNSVPREKLAKRKLLIMACRSGLTSLDGIEHFLQCGYNSDIEQIQTISNHFFDTASVSKYLTIKDDRYSARAKFVHTSDDYDWHEQSGTLEPGDQQVFPSGEVACFLVPLYSDTLSKRRFNLSGEIILSGPSIVQSGPPSFQVVDQERIYEQLYNTNDSGVKITIKDGVISEFIALDDSAKPAELMLEHLFRVDSRYRNIYEVGFSINPQVKLWKGNSAMNEVWGEGGGRLHLGLGMLPYTQYHIDMFCQHSYVEVDTGEYLFGKKNLMHRKKSIACPCTPL